MAVPRRELSELHAKYDFHPELFDIYVEGDFDYDFLNLVLADAGINGASVFCIDDIEVTANLVLGVGLQQGSNKHRVLTLAHLLDQRYKTRNTNLVCIADPDCDRILYKLRNYHHVIYTDYTCTEIYLLNELTIRRFLTFACQLPETAAKEFFVIARLVLPVQFALRATLEALDINKPVLGFETGLGKKQVLLSFNGAKYVNSFLGHHSLQRSSQAISLKFDEIHGALPKDLRNCAHGHDFISLLFEYLWWKGSLKFQDKEKSATKFGARLIAMSFDRSQIVTEPLFTRINAAAAGKLSMKP